MMGGGGGSENGDSPAPDPDPPAADTSFYDNERPGLDPAPAPAPAPAPPPPPPPPPDDDGGQDEFTAYEPPSTPQLPDPPQPDPPDPSFPDNERPGLDPNFPDTSPILPDDDEDDYTAYEPPNVLQLPPEFLPPDFTDPMNTGGPGQPPSGTTGDSDDFPYDQYEPPVYDNEPTMPEPDPDPSDPPPAPDPQPQPQPDDPASGDGGVDDDVVRGEEAGDRRRKRPGRAGEGRTILGSATNYKPTKSVQKKTLLGS